MDLLKLKTFAAILQKKAQQISAITTEDSEKQNVSGILTDSNIVQEFIDLLYTNDQMSSAFADKLNRTKSFDFNVEVRNGQVIVKSRVLEPSLN